MDARRRLAPLALCLTGLGLVGCAVYTDPVPVGYVPPPSPPVYVPPPLPPPAFYVPPPPPPPYARRVWVPGRYDRWGRWIPDRWVWR